MANVDGKATAITVVTPVRPLGWILLRVVFWAARNITSTLETLQTLSFIHYARWAVIKEFPDEHGGERPNYRYLFFESNFNGTWDQYIDAFSEVVPERMQAIWGSSFGFPGPEPVEPFKAYIRHNEFVANHYWSAYPGASTTEIVSAGRVAKALDPLRRRAGELEPAAFKAEYEALLARVEGDL